MQKILLLTTLVILVIFLAGCESTVNTTAGQAISQNNPSLCNNLKEPYEKTRCFVEVANDKKDPNICLQSQGPQEDCLAEYAIHNRVMTPCDLLTDPVKKYTCVAKFTGDSTGRSLEIIIGDWKTKGLVSKCMDQCSAENVACRTGCINAEKTIIVDCNDRGLSGQALIDCYPAGSIKQNCFSDCDQKEWYDCEPPCKELANN